MSRRPFRLTLVHPCAGRRAGMKRYLRTWQMEPLQPALLAALAPAEVERRFYDDRLEAIPYDEPTDLVALSVETFTARRSYQIASEFRRRGVPVVMGGFHATLCTEEVRRHAESVVIGEGEELFPLLLDDYRHGRPQAVYHAERRPPLGRVQPERSIFVGKRYLPIRLVESARGCPLQCDFCAVQSFFGATQSHHPADRVADEVRRVSRPGQLIFFIDDNFSADPEAAKELMRALVPLGIRWVSQASIDVAWDEEALDLMRRSGCQGLLIGFESLDDGNLAAMNKRLNLQRGGAREALERFRAYGVRIYGTFVFGYDGDSHGTIRSTVDFCQREGLFIAGFNHITPFPGTSLYDRLEREGRLLYDAWWLDERYRYNQVPFRPRSMTPEELEQGCLAARRSFYSWPAILRRSRHRIHLRSPFMWFYFLAVNALHHFEIETRSGLPLGDETWQGPFIPAH